MSTNYFPPLIQSQINKYEFYISPESIFDLFYNLDCDNNNNNKINEEINKLQHLLNLNINKIILKKIYGNTSMNREKFRCFVYNTCQLEGNVSDEIFSCAINNFADEDSDELPDQDMTKDEFTTAFVRLANLWSLMNEGMANSSELTRQTAEFLKHVS